MQRIAKLLVGILLIAPLAHSDDSILDKAHRVMADKLYSKGSPTLIEVAESRGYSQEVTESALRVMFDGFAKCSIDFLAARPEPEFRVVLELTAKNAASSSILK